MTSNGKILAFKKEPELTDGERIKELVERCAPKKVVVLAVDDEGNLHSFSNMPIGFEMVGMVAAALQGTIEAVTYPVEMQ